MAAAEMVPSHHSDLYKYWNAVRGARAMPTRSDIDPLDVVKLLPFVGLIERRDDAYYWRLMGTGIVDHFGRDLTGEPYGAHFSPAAFVAATVAAFDAALDQEAPFFDEFLYYPLRGAPNSVSRLVCPLASDGAHLPMVIHTRIHRYCNVVVPGRFSVDEAWRELMNRWPISSLDDLNRRRSEEWRASACPIG
jgi:hypothetical protein